MNTYIPISDEMVRDIEAFGTSIINGKSIPGISAFWKSVSRHTAKARAMRMYYRRYKRHGKK